MQNNESKGETKYEQTKRDYVVMGQYWAEDYLAHFLLVYGKKIEGL